MLADLGDLSQIAMPYDENGTALGHHGYLDWPAGTARCSAGSLAKFLISFMQDGVYDGTTILSADTIEEMRTVQYEDLSYSQGLVWYWDEIQNYEVLGHTGGDPGVSSEMYYDPVTMHGYIWLANAEVDPDLGKLLLNYAMDLKAVVTTV